MPSAHSSSTAAGDRPATLPPSTAERATATVCPFAKTFLTPSTRTPPPALMTTGPTAAMSRRNMAVVVVTPTRAAARRELSGEQTQGAGLASAADQRHQLPIPETEGDGERLDGVGAHGHVDRIPGRGHVGRIPPRG